MTRHHRRAALDADRFGYVRDRERFLYQDPQNAWGRQTKTPRFNFRKCIAGAMCALLLTGAVAVGVLIGIRYTADYSADHRRVATQVVTNQEPILGTALTADPVANSCEHCENEGKIANIAWQYFDNNRQPETGLVNSVEGVESTTLWDTGSSIAAFLAARDFNLITQHDFDHSIMAMLQTLSKIQLVNGVAPNTLYHTRTAQMVDYNNQPVENGIGVSTIDLARAAFWLNTLQCMHPKYFNPVTRVLDRWNYDALFREGEIYGLARDALVSDRASTIQQGRFGFEQYAGRIFKALGHPTYISASYDNRNRANTEILGVRIGHDLRDPRNTGVNNFVLTDSYTLDAMELGIRPDNKDIVTSIYDVQRERWRHTGIPTALTDGHINQPPYFLYNTIFDAGLSFTTTTDTGVRNDDLRTISTRAAFMLASLFPQDPYSAVLLSAVESAYDPDRGWFSGVYENGGFNDVTTANTNGIILQTMLFRKYGVLAEQCHAYQQVKNYSTVLSNR